MSIGGDVDELHVQNWPDLIKLTPIGPACSHRLTAGFARFLGIPFLTILSQSVSRESESASDFNAFINIKRVARENGRAY
jgi:hypothetical protein